MKKILFVSSESVPFIKTGGLADVVGSLPKCFPKEYFEIGTLSGKHYAVHLCAGEWRIKTEDGKGFKNFIKRILKKNQWFFDRVQVLVRKRRYKKLNETIPFYECYLAQKENRPLPKL